MAGKPVESGRLLRKKIVEEIYKSLRDADITRIEFEGPEIAVYVRKPEAILVHGNLISDLARKLRKRITVKTDPRIRKPQDQAIRYILNELPGEAGVTPQDIIFDDELGEVRIQAEKPKEIPEREVKRKILAQTGWVPVIVRKPLLESATLSGILGFLYDPRKKGERKKALRDVGDRIYREVLVGTRRIRIIGLGSFGEVGRSAILVDTGESRILLDAGASPTGFGTEAFPMFDAPEFRIEDLDAVIISHAHLDHVGMLPLLFKYGYRGPVYMTAPTRDIAYIILKDYMELARREGRTPPFKQQDIETVITHTITMRYNTVTDVAPDTKLTFSNAGHILGSALVHLHIGQGLHNILYTGDLKYYIMKEERGKTTRLLPPANYQFHRVETLIIESTYGATDTPPRIQAETELINLINEVYREGGKILIPVMAVGRGQEILAVINRAYRERKIPEDLKVYVDGMIYEVTAIYTAYLDELSKEIRDMIMEGYNPFTSPNTIFVTERKYRDEALYSKDPAVILATSGMMQGGPVIEYFKHLAEDERNALVFVSYQAPGTLGRRLADGEREIQFVEEGRVVTIRVKMKVRRIEGFSGHANKRELKLYLKHLRPKPKTIILNHGEPRALASFGKTIKSGWRGMRFEEPPEIVIPENLEAITVYPRHRRIHTDMLYYSNNMGRA